MEKRDEENLENKMGVLVLMVFFVLSGAVSREISKKLDLDIKIIALLIGVLYSYVLSHYSLDADLVQEINTVIPNVNEFLISSYLITTCFGIEYKK
jgi:ABC-type Mn2+/Zn2+ transport system permease subunit